MNVLKRVHSQFKSSILPIEVINTIFLDKSLDSKKSLLKRACAKGELIRVKNGLYLIGEEDRRYGFHLNSVANLMVRPSYISLETALSYYSLIPEAVYTTTSVTTKRSNEYNTPVGIFSFAHLMQDYFNFGFYHLASENGPYLIATPLKALIDYIVVMNKNYKSVSDLEDDLRFDWDEFVSYKEFINQESVDLMLNHFKSRRLQSILKDIRKRL